MEHASYCYCGWAMFAARTLNNNVLEYARDYVTYTHTHAYTQKKKVLFAVRKHIIFN